MPNRLPHLSLHTRISLVLTALAASLLLVFAGLWLHGARAGIHEEVEAASKVSEQWLKAMAGEMRDVPSAALPGRVLALVGPLGRIRANSLEVFAAAGERLYVSPGPTYKAGRQVPEWFAALLSPEFAPRRLTLGELQLVLRPDPSRSVIDAWDDLLTIAAQALLLLGLLFVTTRWALARALRPLDQVMQALTRTGLGRFDIRLPVFATPELGRLSRAYNGMADRLNVAVDENVRLETERELAEQMQARLQDERRLIARELHDELAQGITAVRSLAGAIIQRVPDQPALHIPAQSIVAVTGEMQDGVRNILQRLRPTAGSTLVPALTRFLEGWQALHPEISIDHCLDIGDQVPADAVSAAVLRIVQEGLTNVVRHAGATQVECRLSRQGSGLLLRLADNGVGRRDQPSRQPGCGFGLTGMGERLAALGGSLRLLTPNAGGFCIEAALPNIAAKSVEEELA